MAKIKIQPLQLWVNGQNKIAEVLEVVGNFDDYETTANTTYSLREADIVSTDENGQDIITTGQILMSGNIICSGQDYIDWDNSNDWIKSWVASQLNLTIV